MKIKQQFLIKHPYYFICSISLFYPLTKELLAKYSNVIFLDRLGENCDVNWTEEFVDLYLEYFYPKGSDAFWFSNNEKLPWSLEFVKKHEGLWNWEGLAQNGSILAQKDILEVYHQLLAPHIVKPYSYPTIEKTLLDIEYDLWHYEEKPWLLYTSENQIESDPHVEWNSLSESRFLPWSHELIKRYEHKWDWERLSQNMSIVWTANMIAEFKDNLFWKGTEDDNLSGFSCQGSFEWSIDFVRRYKDYLDWAYVCQMDDVPWSIDFLVEFEQYLHIVNLSNNGMAWKACFSDLAADGVDSLLNDKNLQIAARRQTGIVKQRFIEIAKRLEARDGI